MTFLKEQKRQTWWRLEENLNGLLCCSEDGQSSDARDEHLRATFLDNNMYYNAALMLTTAFDCISNSS